MDCDTLVQNIIKVIKDVVPIEDNHVQLIKPKLQDVIKSVTDRLDDQESRILALERKQKAIVLTERRREVNSVRNSIILKSKKTVAEIQKFVSGSIEAGGAGKVAMKNVHLSEIPAPVGAKRDNRVYRCLLGEKEKKGLFIGLSKMKPESVDAADRINVENETPRFLSGSKKELERISFTLRKTYKATHNLKTKIILSNLKLKLKIKDTASGNEWFGMEDARAEQYLQTAVYYKADELPRDGAKTCKDHYLGILAALDI